jgi:hypothetical protein
MIVQWIVQWIVQRIVQRPLAPIKEQGPQRSWRDHDQKIMIQNIRQLSHSCQLGSMARLRQDACVISDLLESQDFPITEISGICVEK